MRIKHFFSHHACIGLVLFASISVFFFVSPELVSGAIPASQRNALIDLYDSTNGDEWTETLNWKWPSGTECTWHGVKCDPGKNNVIEINLIANNLVGTIPSSIGSFAAIELIILNDNQLTDSIPAEIGNLSSLEYLSMSGNQLTGSIPATLGNLSSLEYCSLSNNKLTGPIPATLGSLSKVEAIYLYNNQLTGSIPAEIGNLSGIQDLRLQGNHLAGEIPLEITNLKTLTDEKNSDLRWNALYTTDPTVRDFLDTKFFSDWEMTQTVVPSNLTVTLVSDTSIRLNWSVIAYTDDPGGYEVYYSTSSGGPYTLFETTADKSITTSTVTDLAPETKYYFVVRTVTESHANNQNTVYSEFTSEVSDTTSVQTFTLTVATTGTGSGKVTSSPPGIHCEGECSKDFISGAVITLTAVHYSGSIFTGWGEDCSGKETSTQLTVDADKRCTANFDPENIPLASDPGGPYTGTEGQAIILDGSGSKGNIVLYEWDIDNDGAYDYNSSLPTQNHTYVKEDTYTIKLRVTESLGEKDEKTTTASIADASPIAVFTASPTSGKEPLTVNFTNNSTGYDQPLTYEWDFENDGTVDSTDRSPVYIFTHPGKYTVKLTVKDSDGTIDTSTKKNYIRVGQDQFPTCSTDLDLDGYGNPGDDSCPHGSETDCDDNDEDINPGADDSNCDGIDNDCDTSVDEHYTITISDCGVGECTTTGQKTCINGNEEDSCTPLTPPEDTEITCDDGKDNDCDGDVDSDDYDCKPINLLWQDNTGGNYEIFFAQSINSGSTWDSRNLSGNTGNSLNPRSAENGSDIYVIWQEKVKKYYDIYFMRSSNAGKDWDEWQRIHRNKEKLKNPSIAAGGQNIYIIWQRKAKKKYEIYLIKYDGQDKKWGRNQRIYRTKGKLENHAIAAEGSDIYLVWQRYRKNMKAKKYEIYFMHLKDKGENVTKKRLKKLYASKVKQKNPDVAVEGLNVSTVWQGRKNKKYEIYLMNSTDKGNNWNRTILTDKNSVGQSLNPSISIDDSKIYVVWQNNNSGSYDIYFTKSIYKDIWSEPENISESDYISQKPDIKVYGSNVHVVWQDDMEGNNEINFRAFFDGIGWTDQKNISENAGQSLNPILPK